VCVCVCERERERERDVKVSCDIYKDTLFCLLLSDEWLALFSA